VEERLRCDTGHEIKAVLTVQIDTASGVVNDIPAIRKAMDAAGHPALLMVDAVASLGCDELRMDAWGIDILVGASQKGLMTPPGLGIVWASPKAMERHAAQAARGEVRTWYWNWAVRRDRSAHYLRYAGTPPVSHIFALREAATMILEEGIENVWARHTAVADAVRIAVGTWAAPGALSLNVEVPGERADCVTTIRTGELDAEVLRKLCQTEFGLTLGIGLRSFAGSSFRIGHMGYVNATSILGVLATIEAALARLDVPTSGSGVAAAAAALA
jgi:alanine-glyoxylate transaminase/serine-glyoxylate transaminase/serine-pyruvate transaminase